MSNKEENMPKTSVATKIMIVVVLGIMGLATVLAVFNFAGTSNSAKKSSRPAATANENPFG